MLPIRRHSSACGPGMATFKYNRRDWLWPMPAMIRKKSKNMSLLFKLLATIASIVTTLYITVESIRHGLFIVSTIFAIAKVIVILLFFILLSIVLYVLLTSPKASPTK